MDAIQKAQLLNWDGLNVNKDIIWDTLELTGQFASVDNGLLNKLSSFKSLWEEPKSSSIGCSGLGSGFLNNTQLKKCLVTSNTPGSRYDVYHGSEPYVELSSSTVPYDPNT